MKTFKFINQITILGIQIALYSAFSRNDEHGKVSMNKQNKRNLVGFSLIALIFIFNSYFASAKSINFEHINRNNGLPVNSVTCMAQDNKGFMWFGSLQGLAKYNGHSYKTFTYNYDDTTGIPGFLVSKIICANDGLIYLSLVENGFSILDPKTELFKNFRMEDPVTKKRTNVNDMVIDKHGNLWLASYNGLLHFNTKTQQITKHQITDISQDQNQSHQFKNFITSICVDNNNNLYLLGYNGELIYYNTKSKLHYFIEYSTNINESVFLFNAGNLKIINNKLWIASENNGIYIYDLNLKKTIRHVLPNLIISDVVPIKDEIWIGTDGFGVYINDENGNLIKHLQSNPFDPHSISSNAVYSIYQSRENTIWVGCYSTGLNLFNESRHKFNSITEIGKDDYKLTNKSILCIQQKNDTSLFIGTDGGGINILNLKNGKIQPLRSKNNILDNFVVKTICPISNNSFYIGTYSRGMFYCTIQDNGLTEIKPIKRKKPGKYNHVWYIHKVSDTSIWVGYLHAGLSIYNPKTDTFKEIKAFKDHNIHVIKNINNQMWVSAEQKGLFICDENGHILNHFLNDGNNPNSISQDYILEIFKDSQGSIWLGTNTAGLNLMENPDTSFFIQVNNEYNFPAKMITNIEEDANGFLWISTDIGLVRYNPASHKSDLFDNKDGLQGKKFNINSSFNDNNKTLYYGGVEGLSYFHPYMIQRNDIPPQISLTGLSINNKKIKHDSVFNGRVILTKPIEYTTHLELSHKDEDFTLEFAGLHYESSLKNQYKYKLEGFDNDWINTGADRPIARYTNLKKGNFVFKVKAANPDNVWTEDALEIPITIEPPFYLTNGFRITFIIVMAIFITLFIRLRTNKLQKSKTKLEKQINERTQELKEKAETVMQQNIEISEINKRISEYNKTRDKIFSIIAHDLKNPLNAIISFSTLIHNDYNNLNKDEILSYTGIIRQTSVQMNGLIMNLLYWANSQIGKIKPNPKVISVQEVFNEVESISEANSMQKNIKIDFESNQTHVFADYEMMVTILRNLVANSIKFTPQNGQIMIDAFMHNNKTTFTVSDTGMGMPKEQIEKLNNDQPLDSTEGTDDEKGTGLGLYLCKEFTSKNNGRFFVKSSKSGTIITLTFPSEKS